MLNVEELERRHKTYKQKILMPYIAISAASIVIMLSVAFSIFYDFGSKNSLNEEKSQEPIKTLNGSDIAEKNTSKEKIETASYTPKEDNQKLPSDKEEIKTPNTVINEITDEKKVVLSPALGFIDNVKPQKEIKKETTVYSRNTQIKEEILSLDAKKSAPIEQIKEQAAPIKSEEILPSPQIVESKNISIKRKNDDDIKDVIDRFNINHNPSLSLFIAKKYYQISDYEKAYNYALITNELNNNIEESWIIFSKSLVKMNKKEEAIETLKKYVSHSNSSQAKQLLDEILSGKFK